MMKDDIEKVVFTEEEIKKRVEEMGAEISRDLLMYRRDSSASES